MAVGLQTFVGTRAGARPRVIAALLLGLGATTLFVVGLVAGQPITFPDEVIYTDAARSLAAGHQIEVAGAPASMWTYGPVYLVLLAGVFRLAPTVHDAYLAARALNAVLFTSAAIPIYRIARQLVTQRASLLLAVVGVVIPGAVYTTKLQTESLAYPLVMWTILCILAVVAEPTRQHQLALIGLLGLAPLVRFELVALIPASLLTCFACGQGPVRARLKQLLPLIGGVVGATLLMTAVLVASAERGGNNSHGVSLGHASPLAFFTQFGGLLAAFDLSAGIIPVAVLLMAVAPSRRYDEVHSWASGRLSTLAFLTLSLALSLAAVGAAYLAGLAPMWRPSPPPDRYLFYALPPTLIVFARWLESGAPTNRRLRSIAIVLATAPPLAAGLSVHGDGLVATSNALSFMPWMFIRALAPHPWWLILLAAYCGACVTLLMRRRPNARGSVRLVAASLALCTLFAFSYVALGSWNARMHSPPGGWLDAHTDAEVVGVWVKRPTKRQAFAMWETQVTNENLRRAYFVEKPDQLGPERKLQRGRNGELLDHGKPLRPRYVLTSARTRIVGRLVTRSSGLALYEASAPLRVATDG